MYTDQQSDDLLWDDEDLEPETGPEVFWTGGGNIPPFRKHSSGSGGPWYPEWAGPE